MTTRRLSAPLAALFAVCVLGPYQVGAATVPAAPTSAVATPGVSGASVAFTLPVSDGGSPIISYTITSSPGAIAAIGGASPIAVSGLTNGVSYTFTVTAANSAGVSAPSAASNVVVPSPAIAPWYDTLWTRRDTITVEGSSAGAQTNYSVKLTIPYDAAMKTDFSDLRFTDSSGTLLLSYWVETETNSTSALVWVKVPSVPIAPGTVVFYVYYGNPAAMSMSNGDTTFTLFDTFGAGGTPGDWNYTNNVIGEHAIIRNRKLYAPLYDSDHGVNGGLAVLNPINGAVIKHFTIPGGCTAAAPAFDKNGFLHVYDCGGFITKVDENTGTVLQSRSISSALDWEAVPYDPVNDILLIASHNDRSLSAIRASDYSLVWRNTDVDLTYGSSEIAPPLIVGAYVYWQDYSAKLYKISLSTGITVASTLATTVGFPATPYSFSSYSQIIYDSVNDRLYLTNSTGHTAFAINPADLSVAWSKVVESDGWNFNRGGAWHNNVWYVTARETGYPFRSKIYALNTQSSGSVLWTNTTAYDNGAEVSSILADDNYVYAGTYDYIDQDYNKLLILNALDGSVASTVQLLNGVASSIPTFYGGKIIMGLWYDTSGQQVGGYQALQVRDGGGTDDFYYKADLNQTGYVGAFASGPLTARTACAYGLLDPTKWIASGIYSITNCAAVSTVNWASWSNSFKSTLTFGRANTAIRVRARNSEPSSDSWDAYLGFTNTMGSCLPVCFGRNNGQMVFGYDQNGAQQSALGPAYAFNQYNTAEVKMAYPSIQFDVNDSNLAASASWSTVYDRLPIQLGNFKGSATVDWVLVRNFVNPEPTIISSLCSYQLSGNSAYASSAANGAVTVSTNSACNWSGASNSTFLHITSGASGFGNGQVNISIDANATSSQRTGSLTIAGLTFTITQDAAVSLSVAKTHAGNFTQGQTGATYTVTVSNATGAGPTSATVTVTETVPTGLTLVSMAGAGWSCPGGNTCTNANSLAPASSYPQITVTVNVAANAPPQVTNQVSISGGGSATAVAGDLTVINASPSGSATFVKTDTTTQGTWKGVYGADGEAINGDTTSYPSYAQVTITGGPFVWATSTSDVRALQKTGATDRIAGGWYSWSTMSIDVTLTDGNSHQVAMYCLDWDAGSRAERIDVLDALTNAVLDTRTVSGFQNGLYLVWNLQGHVKLKVTVTGGSNAVLNGLFFGNSSTPANVTFVKADTTAQGAWKGVYGADGEAINGDTTSYPSYAQVTFSGNPFVWTASTADVRALQKIVASDRIASGWYSFSNMSIDVNLTDGNTHQLAMYCLDWDGGGARSERIDVLDAVSNAVLDTRTISGFQNGQYLVWTLQGHVKLRLTLTGGANAVLSGLFFGNSPTPAGTAAFVKTDTTTQGTWKGVYGADGEAINGDTTSYPSYARVSFSGGTPFVWAASTADIRAVQKIATTDRIASGWYTWTNMTIDVNLSDGNTHQVAFYCLDFDAGSRAERVDVLDAVSGALLDTQTISGFQSGQYLVWNLTGHVKLKITLTGGSNAVLSGIYFGNSATPAAATFVKTDTTTQGTWKGVYGADGEAINGDTASYPSYAQVSFSGGTPFVWAASTADIRALQKIATTDRIASGWYTWTNMTIDVNLSDGNTHQVAFYCLDFDAGSRAERIDVLDAVSNAVLDTRTFSGFQNGVYVLWNLQGHVKLKVTLTGGSNGVLSGLFFR
jgi:uncharacterized repeat protein (TIGR01451 family)